jgi:predicted acyl esterase
MFSTRWATSAREHGVVMERNVAIPVRAGFTIDCHIVRPDGPGRFPVIASIHPFDNDRQFEPAMPKAINSPDVVLEGGDPNFYVRRGYVILMANCRGTGRSGGTFEHMGDGINEDFYDVIEWAARQPWSSGKVGTFGTSYFAMTAKRVAELKPPSLKTIFAPFGVTDQYRHAIFHGGIFSFVFHQFWLKKLSNLRVSKEWRDEIGRAEFDHRVALALDNPEINIHPSLVNVLNNVDDGGNMLIAEYVLNQLDTDLYKRKAPRYDVEVDIPGYFGGCWGMHMLHLNGDFESFERWGGPKRLTIGPPYYLDRPVYQYQDESLRWFDYWLKGIDTGIADDPPVRLFIQNTGEWKTAEEWPLPQTRWTEFYLHRDGLLSEHELWPDETASSFVEAPDQHGSLVFRTPPMVENTEICGPLVLNLYASTTDTEVLWFVTLFQEDAAGARRTLTRGWLRGSQRRIDPERSTAWQPYHPHDRREALVPGEVYEFNIEVVATGVELSAGMRLGLVIRGTDQDAVATDFIDNHAYGHLWRPTSATISVQHSNQYPSHLLVPITKGNLIGTFMSGGVMPPFKPGQ